MEEEIKSPKNYAECTIYHNGKYCLVVRKILYTKILDPKELNKID